MQQRSTGVESWILQVCVGYWGTLKWSSLNYKQLQVDLTISQKKTAISLRFCRTAQMNRAAQGDGQRLSRYIHSPSNILLTCFIDFLVLEVGSRPRDT